ncbi:MAG: lactate utilization protein B [Planctomycetota bacterium]
MTSERLLHPDLPFDMKARAARAARDPRLMHAIQTATVRKDRGRIASCTAKFGGDTDAVRHHAGALRRHALDHLDYYLPRFVAAARAAGAIVHFARDAAAANAVCVEIARATGARTCVKAKSMVTEEIELVAALAAVDVKTLETDLGEFIVQLDGDAPSHIVTPLIHKNRVDVARAFVRELGAPYTEDPQQLTRIARAYLREKYRRADLGVSGANFLIAETGTVVICTNEGNGDLCVSAPRIHIVLAGVEKVVAQLDHLGVFLKMLARSSTGQDLTVYTTFLTGPRRADEHDGPEQMHIVLVDNGRTRVLERESRELLSCIRCGACLNACPVFRKVGGGHAYGAVYSGPIGAVLTPLLKGLENYPDLPQASSLCGACYDACPVAIDIPKHLIRHRQRAVERRIVSARTRAAFRLWSAVLVRPRLFRFALRAQSLLGRAIATGPARGWVSAAPGFPPELLAVRDLPGPAPEGFRAWWHARRAAPTTAPEGEP